MSDNTRLEVYPDASHVKRAAAERVIAAMDAADDDLATLVLAGGSTPKATYELLGSEGERQRVDWSRVRVLFGDERCVGPAHEDSNYRMAREAMLDALEQAGLLPADNVLRMQGELEPEDAAKAYSATLAELFGGADAAPRFDLVLLGMGGDAHTASLFPGTAALDAPDDTWVAANHVPKLEAHRLTLTAAAINAARAVCFIVTGAGKAEALRAVLAGERDTATYPSQLVAPEEGSLTFLVDRAAAAELPAEIEGVERVEREAFDVASAEPADDDSGAGGNGAADGAGDGGAA